MTRLPAGLLSTKDAGARLGVGAAAVRRAIREGRLPAYHVGGVYLIDARAVAAYARRRARGGRS